MKITGLADPKPVAQTFFIDEDVRARFVLDHILTLVDARHIGQPFGNCRESAERIACADLPC